MTSFAEQVVERTGWHDAPQQDLDASLTRNGSEEQTLWQNASRHIAQEARLSQIVEAEILPRLARARHSVAPNQTHIPPLTTSDDTAELVRLVLTEEAASAVTFINTLLQRGATSASLYLGVLTQAARCLGELWEQDRCDFAQVTVSVGRLQQVLRNLSPLFQTQAARRAQSETVLLVPAPGEQHTFGLVMLAEFFTRDGWHVAGGPSTSAKSAADIVRCTWIDVAGFSIGSRARIEGLALCIRSLRRVSCNPNLCVMVGGPLFLSEPGLVTRVGADSAAIDAPTAVRTAREFVSTRVAAD